MKFLLNTAFFASLALGIASGSDTHASDLYLEDLAYWRELVDNVDSFSFSFPATASPTASPTLAPVSPTMAPVSPTAAPADTCSTICTFQGCQSFSLFLQQAIFSSLSIRLCVWPNSRDSGQDP